MKNILPKLIITTLAGFIPLLIPLPAFAASSLSLTSTITQFWPGDTFSVGVVESSGTTINAVQAILNYPAANLDCLGVSAAGSAFLLPSPDQTKIHDSLTSNPCAGGTITIVEGINGTGVSAGNHLVATINFRVKAPTSRVAAQVNFVGPLSVPGSAVVEGIHNANDLPANFSGGGAYTLCKRSDLICDDRVNYLDASYLGTHWNTNDSTADITNSGWVDILDASSMSTDWQGS